jgi:hypothetical protein
MEKIHANVLRNPRGKQLKKVIFLLKNKGNKNGKNE